MVVVSSACGANALQEKVRAWRVAHEREVIGEYLELLAIPNMTVDRANIRRNADFIVAMMRGEGPGRHPHPLSSTRISTASR